VPAREFCKEDIDDPAGNPGQTADILKDYEALMQPQVRNSLPEPDKAGAEHSRRAAENIRRRIAAAGGAISFADYMHHALYAPGLGYYVAGATKFGEAGDFITAPEASRLFGAVVARQCAEVLPDLGAPRLLEIGAGSGRLAVDVLARLAELDALPESYDILEVSPDLQQRQRRQLEAAVPDLAARVRWLNAWPREYAGIILANEVLDALPVERFAVSDHGIEQICVTSDADGLSMTTRPAPALLAQAVQSIEREIGEPFPAGYVSEICLALAPWIADLAGALENGIAFLFDYGVSRREYYAAERATGWLRCHFRHHAHNDPLRLPGIQDITSWVDFTAVAAAAAGHGLDIAGFVTQAQFMINGGLDAELDGMAEMPIDAQLTLANEVKLLTLPGEMGEHFKCIGLSRGPVRAPSSLLRMDRAAAL
jgi:SAM-dependent MidA family methyltransferase